MARALLSRECRRWPQPVAAPAPERRDHHVTEIKVLYTAEATAVGGRSGHARSSDGRLDVDLSGPEEMQGDGGPGTNPAQLFAAGRAAGFRSPMAGEARGVANTRLGLAA